MTAAAPQTDVSRYQPKPPPAVQAKIDAANELQKRLATPVEPAPEPEAQPDPAPEPKVEAKVEPAPEPKVEAKPDPAPAAEDDGWKRKFEAANGRVKHLEGQIRDLTQEISNLRGVIASVQNAPAAPKAEETFTKLITPEEEAEYGPEFLAVVEKKAMEKLAPYEKKIKDLESKLENVQQTTVKSARDRMFEKLDDDVPEWRALNHDKGFLAWLDQIEPYAGQTRQSLLDVAFNANDASRVVAFFKGYQTTLAPPATETRPQKPSLESLAAPGRAKPTQPNTATSDSKPVFTRAQISGFYKDVAEGKYRNDPAKQRQLEEAIFSATAEGRIR